MQEYGTQYSHGLLTDTRDVVFQLDPFDWSRLSAQDEFNLPTRTGDKLYVFNKIR